MANIIKLGDKEYELALLNLNMLSAVEEEFGCGIDKMQEKFSDKMASTLRTFLWIILKDKYPELTKDIIGQLVTIENLQGINEALQSALTQSFEE